MTGGRAEARREEEQGRCERLRQQQRRRRQRRQQKTPARRGAAAACHKRQPQQLGCAVQRQPLSCQWALSTRSAPPTLRLKSASRSALNAAISRSASSLACFKRSDLAAGGRGEARRRRAPVEPRAGWRKADRQRGLSRTTTRPARRCCRSRRRASDYLLLLAAGSGATQKGSGAGRHGRRRRTGEGAT